MYGCDAMILTHERFSSSSPVAGDHHFRIGQRHGAWPGCRDPRGAGARPARRPGPATRHSGGRFSAGGVVSAPESPHDWPNPATVLEHAERALEALQRAEEEVLALQELCRQASDNPRDPGPVGTAVVLAGLQHIRPKVHRWADTAAGAVQQALSTTPATSGDKGSAQGG